MESDDLRTNQALGDTAALDDGLSKIRYLLISLAVIVLDQWTKWLVEVHLPQHAAEPVIPGFLNLTHVRNTGVDFCPFAPDSAGTSSPFLTISRLAAPTEVGIYFWFTHSRDRLLLTALALVVGGAVGNLVDRISSGAVTDFIDVYVGTWHWPSFNVADSAISVGIVLMAIDSFRPHRHREQA